MYQFFAIWLQVLPCLTVLSNLALTDRNMDAKNYLKVVLKSWDNDFFLVLQPIFYEILSISKINSQLGGVHKLRLQDEVGRWLSKCQQMLTKVL